MKQFLQTGKFPPFEYDPRMDGVGVNGEGKDTVRQPTYIESQMRLVHWFEVGKIFAVLISLGVATRLVL